MSFLFSVLKSNAKLTLPSISNGLPFWFGNVMIVSSSFVLYVYVLYVFFKNTKLLGSKLTHKYKTSDVTPIVHNTSEFC